MKKFEVTFPGGKKVDAHYDGFTVHTDQSVKNGGEGSAPEPFDLFFVSMSTCVGIYALEFCNSRDLNTEGLAVNLEAERDPARKLFTPIRIMLTLPKDFPEKYEKAIRRAADLCTVKKHVIDTPDFEITTRAANS
ncbi:MAG: OsmC family protein [Verrucomicrobia bacterium]|nr:OsmC family protein [Verrucomicrobiota bacterium]